jgi:hypothetical protein
MKRCGYCGGPMPTGEANPNRRRRYCSEGCAYRSGRHEANNRAARARALLRGAK